MNAHPRYIVCECSDSCACSQPPFVVHDQQAAICGEVARCRTREDAERIAALLNVSETPDPASKLPAELMARITRAAALLHRSHAMAGDVHADARLIGAALDVLTGGDKARAANGLDCAPLVAGARDWMAEAEYANHHEPVLALLCDERAGVWVRWQHDAAYLPFFLIAAAGDEAPRVRGRYSDLDAAIDAMIVCYTRLRQPPLPGILADLSDRMERAQQRVLELAVCARAAEDAGDPAEADRLWAAAARAQAVEQAYRGRYIAAASDLEAAP